MPIVKLAIWYDPNWRSAMWKKGNWHKPRYWYQRRLDAMTIGPWRIDIKRAKHGE